MQEERTKQSPDFFIVGCPRSGTTLLQRIVNAHPQIAVSPEIFWITHYVNSRKGPNLSAAMTREMVDDLVQHKRFPELQMEPAELQGLLKGSWQVTAREFLTGVFEIYGKHQGKPVIGNKTPQYVQNIPEFHLHWPKAKFVHLIRDGRDVCLSILNWKKADRTAGRFATWQEDPIITTALWWKRNVRLGREAGNILGSNLYYEVRYEEIVRDANMSCKKLCDFLEVQYDPLMLHHHEIRPVSDPHPNAKSWNPITPGLRNWKSQLTSEQQEQFEAAAGDLLTELGYERAFEDPSSQKRDHASAIYDRFTADIRTVGKLLPAQW